MTRRTHGWRAEMTGGLITKPLNQQGRAGRLFKPSVCGAAIGQIMSALRRERKREAQETYYCETKAASLSCGRNDQIFENGAGVHPKSPPRP